MRVTLVTIASACHRVNRAFCLANGDDSQPEWDQAPQWQRESAIKGVALHITDPNMTPEASHNAWLEQKTRDGWSYGPKKDPENRKHPCFLPYAELPAEQKAKDYLFKAVVDSFRTLLPGGTLAEAADIAQSFHVETSADLPEDVAPKSGEQLEAEGSAEHEEQAQAHADELAGLDLETLMDNEPVQDAGEAPDAFAARHERWLKACEAAMDSDKTATKTPSVEKDAVSA